MVSIDHFSREGYDMGPKTTENLKAAFAGESQVQDKAGEGARILSALLGDVSKTGIEAS